MGVKVKEEKRLRRKNIEIRKRSKRRKNLTVDNIKG